MTQELERNAKLFYIIAEAIEENPQLHDQDQWLIAPSQGLLEKFIANRKVECGTSQCIAGWAWVFEGRGPELAELLTGRDIDNAQQQNMSIIGEAAKILGLSDDEANQIFFTLHRGDEFDWPGALRAIGDGGDIDAILEDGEFEID